MEALYECVGIRRQGFHQYLRRRAVQSVRDEQILDCVREHRRDHPRMGARPMRVVMCRDESERELLQRVGKHKFEKLLIDNDLGVQPIRIYHRTTYSGIHRFPNLVEGVTIQDLNKIWVSDLTYYLLRDGWAYLTFILELYSRRCIGYQLSRTMDTESTTLPALEMALKNRGIKDYHNNLCFHSDGGGQYYDKAFVKLLRQYNIRSSMAECVYENPHIERFHSTIKNDYLIPWGVNSTSQLKKQVPRAIELYNSQRPHQSLKLKTPQEFEEFIQPISLCQRPSVLFKKIT